MCQKGPNYIKNPRALFCFIFVLRMLALITRYLAIYLLATKLYTDSCTASSINRLACMVIDWLCVKTESKLLYLLLKMSTELTYFSSLRTSNRHCKKLCPLSLIPSMVSLNTSMARWSILSSHSSWLGLPWPVTICEVPLLQMLLCNGWKFKGLRVFFIYSKCN